MHMGVPLLRGLNVYMVVEEERERKVIKGENQAKIRKLRLKIAKRGGKSRKIKNWLNIGTYRDIILA